MSQSSIPSNPRFTTPEVINALIQRLSVAIRFGAFDGQDVSLALHKLVEQANEIERLTRELAEAHRVFAAIERLPDETTAERELVEDSEQLRAALERAVKAMHSATVFVNSRERIKRPEGEEWWADEIFAAEQAIERLYESREERGSAVKASPSRGICYKHCWGAPVMQPGHDDDPCPYCTGELPEKS